MSKAGESKGGDELKKRSHVDDLVTSSLPLRSARG